MPNHAPILPPNKASKRRFLSEIRHLEFLAFCLSIPYIKKETKLNARKACIIKSNTTNKDKLL